MDNLQEVLKNGQEIWGNSGDITPGQYNAIVLSMVGKEVGKDDKAQWKLIWTLRITGPKFSGKSHTMFTPLQGEYLWVTKDALKKCGLVFENLMSLPAYCEKLINKEIEIDIKINDKGYPNTYVLGLAHSNTAPQETSSDSFDSINARATERPPETPPPPESDGF